MKHFLRIGFLGWLYACLVLHAYGQQQAMFTQYMFNGLVLNPAYAGSHQALSLTAVARQQWTGFDGSPSTQTFSAHSPIGKKDIALGALFMHDRIGVTSQAGMLLSGAYQLRFRRSVLSLGAQGGVTYQRIFWEDLLLRDPADPNFPQSTYTGIMPQVGTGLYFYSDWWYLGFSVPQLLTSSYAAAPEGSYSRQQRHYFLTGGYVFDLGQSFKLKPSVLIKAIEGAPLSIDLNTNLLIKEVLWIGCSYRHRESVAALAEVQLTDQFRLGYSYDFVTSTQSRRVTTGSHEVMLSYRFAFAKNRLVTPRFF